MLNYCLASTLSTFGIELTSFNAASFKTARIVNNSLDVEKDDIFCAVIGSQSDAKQYIESAVANGASAVICETVDEQHHGDIQIQQLNNRSVPVIQFYQLNQQLFLLAQRYYQNPNNAMKVIGITGTNGKTTTTAIVSQLLEKQKQSPALIGTLGAGSLNQLQTTKNTTPAATELFTLMSEYKKQGINVLTMEVSSHALVQKRVLPELFDIAVFTNLSRDHLDYHKTMTAYAQAKFSLFTHNKQQIAVINGDDAYGAEHLKQLTTEQLNNVFVFGSNAKLKTYPQYVIANNISFHSQGVTFSIETRLGGESFTSPLLGHFNVENVLAAIATMLSLGFSLNEVKTAVNELNTIAGRMEVYSATNMPTAIVDYAHTPEGLSQALMAIKQHFSGKTWVLFGCGGERDQGKRAEMGRIAEQYADKIFLTDDNPRNESPEKIVSDILQGVTDQANVTVELNRENAVQSIIAKASREDSILFAGKGHEQYITYGDKKVPYNERQLIQALYQEATL